MVSNVDVIHFIGQMNKTNTAETVNAADLVKPSIFNDQVPKLFAPYFIFLFC